MKRLATLCALAATCLWGCLAFDDEYDNALARISGGADGGGDAGEVADGSTDAGPADAGPSDAGPPDAGPPDAGPPDAGPPDAGPPDAGPPDAGPPDAGPPDAGPPDAGPPDAGPPDAGPPDAGPPDAGPPDAGCLIALCLRDRVSAGWNFRALSGTGPHQYVAAGRYADGQGDSVQLAKTEGLAWTFEDTSAVAGPYLTGFSAASQTVLFATDTFDATVLDNGTIHTTTDCGLGSGAPYWYGADAVSEDEAWFSGQDGQACHWRRDAGFQAVEVIPGPVGTRPTLRGVKGFADGTVFFAGETGTLVSWPAGGDAGVTTLASVSDLYAISGTSPDNVVAVGDYGAIHSWNADAGTWTDLTVATEVHFRGVSVVGPDDAWAAGGTYLLPARGYLFRWDGGTWAQAAAPDLHKNVRLFGVAASADEVAVAGTDGDGGLFGTGTILRFTRGP